MVDKVLHMRENRRIIGRCSEHELAVTERIGNGLCHIATGEICDNDVRAAALVQFFGKLLHSFFRVTVDGGVGDDNALVLDRVGRPCVVFIKIIAEIFV